jgi:transcriptional regulator with GAF, ATPase, and Fis domain
VSTRSELDDALTDVQTDRGLTLLPPASRRRAVLTVHDARGPSQHVLDGTAVLGSAEHVSIPVHDAAVSRLHVQLELRDDGLWATDLGSRNGTFVQGVRVVHARVDPGQRLRVGHTDIAIAYEAQATPLALWPLERFGPMVGRSVAMRELFARMGKLALSDAPVLVHGETGTGKELVARAIHEASARARGPYVVVDCAALPETLLESELFGHAKGAFTGATSARRGAIEVAEGGTVFLDEIGELPLTMQPKLLRLLESRTVRRLGETDARPVDVRFIAATHRDLARMVNEGSFREDLYFRLAVLPLAVPPLRDRGEDIPLLVERFLPKGAHLDPDVVAECARRPWAGNVRELRSFVERAVALGADEALRMSAPRADPVERFPPVSIDEPFKVVRERWLTHLEREYVARALERHGGNVSAVAEAAGLDRSYVHRLIRKHEL